MYRHLAQFADGCSGGHVLSISHSEPLCHVLGFAPHQITDASYPEYNILDLPFSDESFDTVVSDQVLEHVEGDPFRAVSESLRVLKPGGMAVHTTCLINPVHGAPGDCWRFTPDGLRLLVGDKGSVIDANGWGNPLVWPYCMLGLRYEPVPQGRWHPANWIATFNHSDWAIVTWVVVRKGVSPSSGS